MSGAATTEEIEDAPVRKSTATNNVRRLEEARRARIADAKVTLQDAKRSLNDARARAQIWSLSKKRRKPRRRKLRSTGATQRSCWRRQLPRRKMQLDVRKAWRQEVEEAAKTVEVAKRALEQATKELDSLLRQ